MKTDQSIYTAAFVSGFARTFRRVSREVRNSCPPTLMCTTDGTWSKIVKSSSTMTPRLSIDLLARNVVQITEQGVHRQQTMRGTDRTAMEL